MTLRLSHMVLWSLVITTVHAQRTTVVTPTDGNIPSKWSRPFQVNAPDLVDATVGQRIAFLHGKGFLEASCDTCSLRADTATCPITVGRPYRWASLRTNSVPKELLSEAGSKERFHEDRPIDPVQFGKLLNTLLRQSENNGYPFARVWLDSITPSDDGLYAVLRMDRGRLVAYDSIVVRGNVKTNSRFLQASIGIRPGDLYNEAILGAVEMRLRELPFVVQRERPYVQFTPEATKLFLFLDTKRASSINGILGLQPDPVTGNITLTGDLDLRLRNALRRGEAIELNWRRLQNGTQDLKVHSNLPFAFNTPFGIDGTLKLFRRDTTFLELSARAGLEYLMLRGDKVTLFVNSRSSDRLGSNTIARPGLADVDLISYGLGLFRERFDYRFNPRKGHALQLEGSAGRKRSTQAVFGQLEPAVELRTVQFELSGSSTVHVPIARRGTVRLAVQGGRMENDDLYLNELHRIGGLKTMRGQDEASILASSYLIGTLEYRFLFEENSNFFVFVDQGWWERDVEDAFLSDTPLGFGAGSTFETKAGLFSLTYALGQQFDDPVLLRGGKVHFGFISLF